MWTLLAASGAAAPAGERRVALVIGNGAYANGHRLANPLNDAQDMCAALQALGYETLCRTNLVDRQAFVASLKDFTDRLTPTDKGFFYYAGHAVQVGGENYLVPTRAQVRMPSDLGSELMAVRQVLDQLKGVRNAFNMVVLDACRNDPFSQAAARGRGITASVQQAIVALPKIAVSQGLGAIQDAPVGSIVLFATGSEEAAYDGDGRNGPLTKHLLAHIQSPGISVEEVIKRTTLGVQSDTQRTYGQRQTPFVYSSFTGEFCFAGCGPKVDAADMERLRQRATSLEDELRAKRANDDANRPAPVFVPPTL